VRDDRKADGRDPVIDEVGLLLGGEDVRIADIDRFRTDEREAGARPAARDADLNVGMLRLIGFGAGLNERL
jgi:hypothetical protein